MQVVPYKEEEESKKKQIATMFTTISKRYDLLNHLLSMGIDILWRKRAVRILKPFSPKIILDTATGTGDFAIESLSLNPTKIYAVDISKGMIEVGKRKVINKKVDDIIEMQLGDTEQLVFNDNFFDAVTVAFGVRNYENLRLGLSEMYRVMKPGGNLVIIEFSIPSNFFVRRVYNFYFNKILPLIGKFLSKDKAAYTYLPKSVSEFPHGKDFLMILNETGFIKTKIIPLTFGISSIYWARK